MSRIARTAARGFLTAAILTVLSVAVLAAPIKIGAVGDSLTDEYSQYLAALAYGDANAVNWVDQLATNRPAQLTFGTFATSGSPLTPPRLAPRYFGYEYNYARSGASTATAISEGQHTGLSAQPVNYAVLAIGTNDFSRVTQATSLGIPIGLQNVYGPIYNGDASFLGADLATYTSVSSYVNSVVARYTTILDQLQSTGIHVVMANVVDYGSLPATVVAFPDASKRQHVTDAVAAVNTQLAAIAHARGLPLVDLFSLASAIGSSNPLVVGGISLTPGAAPSGGNANYRFLPDGTHPGTVASGLLGNAFLEAINRGYGESLTLQSDLELLANAHIAGGVAGQFNVGPYVIVPEPSALALLAIGCLGSTPFLLPRPRRHAA